ncbi:MAG: hypothetical protein M1834_005855 [Cirrosporium novae-zelandiae]|nr:MAG: hypothetical protein M1834_005855 [Cirrosporium novae-zelandiae]
MAVVSGPLPPVLATNEALTLFSTTDPYLPSTRWLLFYGPASNTNVNSSRIQAHIFSPAGFKSFPKLIVAPTSPLYAAVNHLPREEQGDDISRGLAVSMLKYFAELPVGVKEILAQNLNQTSRSRLAPKMFDEMHAATISTRMVEVKNTSQIVETLMESFPERTVSWIDVDLALPNGIPANESKLEDQKGEVSTRDDGLEKYGKYAPLVEILGEPAFLPTSKLRRAPSQVSKSSRDVKFLRQQKESLRRTMCEVVDTEERYVSKLYDLLNNIAKEFRQKASSRPATSTSPTESALARLFPASLDQILKVNTEFLEVIRKVLEDTDEIAMQDIQADDEQTSQIPRRGSHSDPTGLSIFAKALNEWFPKFRTPYEEYMRASTGFSKALQDFTRDTASSFSKRVQETGEQKLKSMLIEPVQRLPRYSLFIDTMINVLPASFPAVKSLLKARDIITDICSLDSDSPSDASRVLKVLQRFINDWPPALVLKGRLINVMDIHEFEPAYQTYTYGTPDPDSVLLMFTDILIIARKPSGCKTSARDIMAEIDHAAVSVSNNSNKHMDSTKLHFQSWEFLHNLQASESQGGRILWLTGSPEGSKPNKIGHFGQKLRSFYLLNSRQGRFSHFVEDFVKARVEGRFSESERESGKWSLRRMESQQALNLLTSIFESGADGSSRDATIGATVKIFICDDSNPARSDAKDSTEIVATISVLGDRRYRIDCSGLPNSRTQDTVELKEVSPTLLKRLHNLLTLQFNMQNPQLAESIIIYNRDILDSLHVHADGERHTRSFRPPSPVKLFSSLLGNSSFREPSSPTKRGALSITDNIPRLSPPAKPTFSQDNHNHDNAVKRVNVVESDTENKSFDSIQALEGTFHTYALALESRSGNIVGRVLRSRGGADELMVNELYNALLEDSSQIQAAAEATIDVLFSAFEKFMGNAWQEKVGPILSAETLDSIQEQFSSMRPDEFMSSFSITLENFIPQNRRVFVTLVGLLARLLDASGNDGDRGALTEAFAELLVGKGKRHEAIPLLDRLVDNADRLFEGGSLSSTSGSTNTIGKIYSLNAGSVNSNTSSFRRRFGLGRAGSKNDPDSRVNSIWRTLRTKGIYEPSSLSGNSSSANLIRSKSIDTDTRLFATRRPGSRDKLLLTASTENIPSQHAHATSTHIAELHGTGPTHARAESHSSIKKKRRSSLSDLPDLQQLPSTPNRDQSIVQHSQSPLQQQRPSGINARQTTPPSMIPRSVSRDIRSSPKLRSPVSLKKENSPLASRNRALTDRVLAERSLNKGADELIMTSINSPKVGGPTTGTGSRSGPRDMPGRMKSNSVSIVSSKKYPQPQQRLRMQSPQKLRERLKGERQALEGAEVSLQAELRKIGQELSGQQKQGQGPSSSPQARKSSVSGPSSPTRNALIRVASIESKNQTTIKELTNRISGLEKDLEYSLQVSEKRAKGLDQLYREANAENEMLYERFNDELDKISKTIKADPEKGLEELQSKMKALGEEAGKLRRENQRLKRENVGLRGRLLE